MPTTLKEWLRQSIAPYLTKIKATFYTKTEVDSNIAAKNATNILLSAYSKPVTGGAIGATDSTQVAIGKLEKGLEDATAGGGEANVQSDYASTDPLSDAYILNKPDLTLKADLVAGKVPTAQLPDSVLGGMQYQGTWNATGVAPAHGDGFYYIVSVAGTTNLDGETDWQIGDWAVSNGTAWSKIDNTQAIQAVSGDSIVAPFSVVTTTEADNDFTNA